MQNFNCTSQNDMCYGTLPRESDIWIDKSKCRVRLDIRAEKVREATICGYICDCRDRPVIGALVKLLKHRNNGELELICKTYSDQDGFYQFELAFICEGLYRVSASKCNDNECSRCNNCNRCNVCMDREYECGETQCSYQGSLKCINQSGRCGKEKQNSVYYY